MKKYLLMLVIATPIFTWAQSRAMNKEYIPQVDFSLASGFQNFKNLGVSAFAYGIGVSFQCPLVNNGKSKVRQQFSLSRQENKKFRSLSLEMSPQFKIIAKPSFELGIGPSAGLVYMNESGDKKKIFTYGIGGAVTYNFKRIFIGVESRYCLTKKMSFGDLNSESELPIYVNLNNLKTLFKIGYKLYN